MPEKDIKKDFIHENIVNQDKNKGKNTVRHFAITACSALLFGLHEGVYSAIAGCKHTSRHSRLGGQRICLRGNAVDRKSVV